MGEAASKFKNITVYKTRFRPMMHSFPKSEMYTMMKVIVDTATDKVVGCHIATDGAGEMVQGVAIAIKMGATKSDFDKTIGIHPTTAEELVNAYSILQIRRWCQSRKVNASSVNEEQAVVNS